MNTFTNEKKLQREIILVRCGQAYPAMHNLGKVLPEACLDDMGCTGRLRYF